MSNPQIFGYNQVSSTVKYFQEKLNPLIGAKFIGLAEDEDGFFGLIMEKNGKKTILWVQQDAEGNGAGWLDVDQK